ncbi:MAG TPA: carboxymuconolactone decarboxylase family protein [Xanthobacteraceae bacterium]|nr:carboxymuconolactone decarboxylase family protein [Xanthobacteraceae bacterium]
MPASRLPDLSDDEMTPAQRRVADALRSGPRKGLPGPFHALLRSPELCERVRLLGDYLRFETDLPPALRELAVLVVARFFNAHYEWQAHKRLGLAAGLDPSIPDAIERGERPPKLTSEQALVYDFVHQLFHAKDVDDATFEKAVARYGEKGTLELICLAGYYAFVSQILNAKRHPLPEGARPLPPLA